MIYFLNKACIAILLCWSLAACSTLPPEPDVPDALIGGPRLIMDQGIIEMTPAVQDDMTVNAVVMDMERPLAPPECEVSDVVPADLRGDIEYAVLDSSDVIVLGLGHDTRRDELLQECVTGMSAESGAQDTVFEVHEIESRSQLSEDLKVDGRIKGGFLGIGFDNRTNLARSREINMYDLNILINVRVQTGSQSLVSDLAISEQNALLLTQDPFEFSRRCGDRFVQQVTYGGELIIILSISTTSESDRRELSNRLSASFGLWGSASVNVQRDVQTELEGREFNVLIERSGGGGTLPNISSPEQLFAYAQAFPQEVESNDPAIFEFVTRPYDRIVDTSPCLPGFDRKSIELMELAWETINEAIGLRNALDDAIQNPQDYACGTNQQRRADLEAVEAFLEEAEQMIESCAGEMLAPNSSITTSPACRSLSELLSAYQATPMPLRWQTVLDFSVSPKQRTHSLSISPELSCPSVDISGRWSHGTGRNHPWMDCPIGVINNSRYEIFFQDPGGYDDNQGTCEYSLRCMNEQDLYLLDQCE